MVVDSAPEVIQDTSREQHIRYTYRTIEDDPSSTITSDIWTVEKEGTSQHLKEAVETVRIQVQDPRLEEIEITQIKGLLTPDGKTIGWSANVGAHRVIESALNISTFMDHFHIAFDKEKGDVRLRLTSSSPEVALQMRDFFNRSNLPDIPMVLRVNVGGEKNPIWKEWDGNFSDCNFTSTEDLSAKLQDIPQPRGLLGTLVLK